MNQKIKKCLVSCCLTGLPTRYDGICKPHSGCLAMLKDYTYIPVCPEQLGGLPTPRPAADIVGGDGFDVLRGRAAVMTVDKTDLSREFIAGARTVLEIAQAQNIQLALLKSRSPSCASSTVPGVTAALLLENDIQVIEF
ncbi:MAG: DUF523 domain-containing protein [Desulfobulbus sp.]|nr:MAG: DUF523 domain-containing protein [Desulfobulbus sp.]RUM39903.1 MAG: DUF523 domain-containing protein [Desulfobulbus sp.]